MRPQRACSDKILVIDFAFQLLMTAPCMPVPSPSDLWCGHGFCVYFTASEPQSLPRLGARLSLTPQHHNPGPDPRLTPLLARGWIQPRPFFPPWGFCVCWTLRTSEWGISLPRARAGFTSSSRSPGLGHFPPSAGPALSTTPCHRPTCQSFQGPGYVLL